MTKKVGVLISGRGSNMRALVEQARGYEVALVASDRPEAAGLAWAHEQGIPTFALSPKEVGKPVFEAALDGALRAAGVELVALAGYMRLLSPDFVARWAGRLVNIHPSLLPAYKGLDTHARALAAGDAETGCSVHLVTDELDAGEVLGQARVPVLPGDDADTLAARVLAEEHRLYSRVLAEWAAMSPDPDAQLARVRALALALPAAAEKLSHGSPGFHIEKGKFFAYFWHDHHGDGETTCIVKTSGREEQAQLIEMDPDFYYSPPYLGPSGWVAMRLSGEDTDWDRVGDRIAASWELVAPARLLEAGGR